MLREWSISSDIPNLWTTRGGLSPYRFLKYAQRS